MKKKFPKPVELPSGSWRCQVSIDGKRRSVTAESPMDAVAAALALRDGKEKNPGRRTLGVVIDEYISNRSAVLSPSTLKAYRSYREHRFQAYMGKRLDDLDRRTLQRMVNDEARVVSPKTVRNAWGLVAASLKDYGVDTAINLPAVPPAERPWLTADEVLLFCSAVRGQTCEIPALLALCSLRRSEIAALEWNDIDLKAGTINVRRSYVEGSDGFVEKKTNKTASSTRVVPIIIPQLSEALRRVKDKAGKLTYGHPNTIYTQVNKVCRDAGLPAVGIHGLRHSFASLCHYLGIPEMECARMGGWSDLGTMRKIYTHLSDKQITDSAERLQGFFGG